MRKLYLKNFKGFKEEVIDLMDVNFFVGENSTGKTSILKLINILSSQEFWFKTDFNNNDVELGYFDEILNQYATDRTFSIGFENSIGNKVKRIVFEFVSKDNVPSVSKVRSSLKGKDLILKFSTNRIDYCLTESIDDFRDWARKLDTNDAKKQLKSPAADLPFGLVLSLVRSKLERNKHAISKSVRDREDKDDEVASFSFTPHPLYSMYSWLAPIRAKPRRIYESYRRSYSSEGEHIPVLLRDLIKIKKIKRKRPQNGDDFVKSLLSFGKESGLFDKIEIDSLGKNSNSAFGVDIVYDQLPIKLPNVGYGVSQVLPIVVEILLKPAGCLSIQQPEVHLHPKAQSAFGRFLFDSCHQGNFNFLIETHSDFVIDRFRYELSKSKAEDKPSSQVLFFERDKSGNRITPIKISEKGEYDSNIPDAFRSFFIDEELRMLEI